jgi:dephospho-CoA kinase
MEPPRLRIALVGKSGSGKSEVAEFLRESRACQVIKTGRICRQIAQLLFGNEDKRSTQLLDDVLTEIG